MNDSNHAMLYTPLDTLEGHRQPVLEGDDVVGVRACPVDVSDVEVLAALGSKLANLGAKLTQINHEINTALNAVRRQQMDLLIKLAKVDLKRWE